MNASHSPLGSRREFLKTTGRVAAGSTLAEMAIPTSTRLAARRCGMRGRQDRWAETGKW